MAFTYGFFNSVEGDRTYNAAQFSSIFDGLITDGIYQSVGDRFKVTPGTGMQVVVGTGRAWLKRKWIYNSSPYAFTLDPSTSAPRIDAVVLTVNLKDNQRRAYLHVIAGTPSQNPSPPSVVNEVDIYRMLLATVWVSAGVTEITSGFITNLVGTSAAPYITGILQTANIDELYERFVSPELYDKIVALETEQGLHDDRLDLLEESVQPMERAVSTLSEDVEDLSVEVHREFNDLKSGADGVTYTSTGNSLRTQVEEKVNGFLNLYNPFDTDIRDQGFYSYNNIWTLTYQHWSTGYIPVEPGKFYAISDTLPNDTMHITFYDSGKSYVSGLLSIPEEGYITIPTGVRYMRFWLTSLDKRWNTVVSKGPVVPPSGIPYNKSGHQYRGNNDYHIDIYSRETTLTPYQSIAGKLNMDGSITYSQDYTFSKYKDLPPIVHVTGSYVLYSSDAIGWFVFRALMADPLDWGRSSSSSDVETFDVWLYVPEGYELWLCERGSIGSTTVVGKTIIDAKSQKEIDTVRTAVQRIIPNFSDPNNDGNVVITLGGVI